LFSERDSLNGHLPIRLTLRKPGAASPSGVGARYLVGLGGIGITEETTELVPGERMEYRVVAGVPVKRHVGTITFADAPEGTLVSYRMESEPKFPVPDRLTEAVLRGLIAPFLAAARKAVAQ
jgi:hypothetical protein